MKKLYCFIIAVLILAMLTACGSATIKDATAAFQNNDYETVVSLLEDFETSDPEVESMLLSAQIHIAFEDEDYQEVLDLAEKSDELPEDLQDTVTLSEAYIEFEDKNYTKVVSLLSNREDRYEYDLYTISIAYAVEDAFAKYDIDTLVDLYEEDTEIEDTLYQLITDRCGNFDYDCFVFAEAFANELPDTMLKLELNRYLSNNSKNKIKAFMQGEWLIIFDEAIGDVATVKCIVNEDDSKCVGYLTSFSSYLVEYHYAENDVYWSGFVFDGDQPITVNNMLRKTSGHFEYVPAKVELSLEKEEMYITIFSANAVSPVRTCRKIQTQE